MAERKTSGRKPLAARAKNLSRIGLAAALTLTPGLFGQPVLARPAGIPAMPAQIEVLKSQGLAGQARAIKTHWQTHFTPESAPNILNEKDYQGPNEAQRFFSASTDLTRLMATYPDWLAGEHFAQASRFTLDPGIVSKMDPLSKNSSEFNPHVFRFLKRAAFVGKGKEGISPYGEFGGMDASEKLRTFYHKLDSEHIKTAAEIYREAFKEYGDNDVYWDSVFIKYGITPTSIVDFMIAKRLNETKSDEFEKALKNASQKDKDFVKMVVREPGSATGVPASRQLDPNRWNDAYRTYLSNYGLGSKQLTTAQDERDMVVSHGYIIPESPSSRYARLAVFYDRLASSFLDGKGNFKRDIVSKKDLEATAQAKISVLGQKIEQLKQSLNGEQSKPRKDALTELISDFEKRVKTLQEKYVKQQ